MKNGQPDAQGQLLLENAMPIISEDEEKMIKEASSIADMMKSPEMKFFRKFPKKIQKEVITIEDSDEDPIVMKDSTLSKIQTKKMKIACMKRPASKLSIRIRLFRNRM